MVLLITAKSGHKAIKMRTTDLLEVEPGAIGICDSCGNGTFDGYYIPVLNSFYCEKCFREWEQRAVHYQEDDRTEQANFDSMVERLAERKLL